MLRRRAALPVGALAGHHARMRRTVLVAVLFGIGCGGGGKGTQVVGTGATSGSLGGSPGGFLGGSVGGAAGSTETGAGGQAATTGGGGVAPIGGSPGTAGNAPIATGGASPRSGQGGTVETSTGGIGGHGGAPSTSGSGGSAVACMMAGTYCPDPNSCCSDSTCVLYSGGIQACAFNCTTGSECASGCCAPLSNSTTKVCSQPSLCTGGPPPQPEAGTVIAADSLSGHLVIQTSSGQQLFSALGGCFLTSGTVVTFSQSTAGCVSNTLTYSTGTCSVECDGAGYAGQFATTTTSGEYSISTQFGTGMYRGATGACPLVFQGNEVLFFDTPA